MISTEHRRRGLEIATRQRLSDGGGRHRFALPRRCDETERLDLEAVDGPHLLEEGHVAGAPVPEVEVLADDDTPSLQAFDEDVLDEVLRGLR